jgi:hypothetical protein
MLLWRRSTIGSNGCLFERSRPILKYLTDVDLNRRGQPSGEYRYRYTQYCEPVADPELARTNRHVRGKVTLPCTVEFAVMNP